MKKVVVVVSTDMQPIIEGENLKPINTSRSYEGTTDKELLIIQDGKEDVAVFNVWLYWKKLE